ncbi:MAG: ATP-binding protein [Mediterranea sp.]|jgi:predicted ATPase|nr:ATP-binding protein [Mediterranea sp.]
MSRIKIKNFGPIRGSQDDCWLEVKRITVLIGTQGSGKSTVAKLISTFSWIEKALAKGDYEKSWFGKQGKFRSQYLSYHRLENYLTDDSYIEYQGDAYTIVYSGNAIRIEENRGEYILPQIMYVPAERNFLAYIKGVRELKLASGSLAEFNAEYEKAKNAMKGVSRLPINNVEVEYNKQYDTLYVLKGDHYKVRLTEASSGFQSLTPLFLVSDYLAKSVKSQMERRELMSSEEKERFQKGVSEIWQNQSLTDEQRRIALSALSSRFNKGAFINIVEEPEQNLYPTSQWEMLKTLLALNNGSPENKLVATTHSPYLINYLTLAIKAGTLLGATDDQELTRAIEKIIPKESAIKAEDVAIYELGEDGMIHPLETYHGLPSDENQLNANLDETNALFARLLEIQQRI